MSGMLAPMAFTVFAGKPLPDRAQTLAIVNRLVNMGIIADRRHIPLAQETWCIGPVRGQCHDYAVTKRWLLLGLGFKPSELLLCECIAPDGEHHLVLRVDEDVLDNLTPVIGPMRYPVVRQQTPGNPDFWESA